MKVINHNGNVVSKSKEIEIEVLGGVNIKCGEIKGSDGKFATTRITLANGITVGITSKGVSVHMPRETSAYKGKNTPVVTYPVKDRTYVGEAVSIFGHSGRVEQSIV